jgi:hypothetical protein
MEFPVPVLDPHDSLMRTLAIRAAHLVQSDQELCVWIDGHGLETVNESSDIAHAILDAAAAQLVGLDLEQVGRLLASFHRNWDHADHLARVKEVWSTIT